MLTVMAPDSLLPPSALRALVAAGLARGKLRPEGANILLNSGGAPDDPGALPAWLGGRCPPSVAQSLAMLVDPGLLGPAADGRYRPLAHLADGESRACFCLAPDGIALAVLKRQKLGLAGLVEPGAARRARQRHQREVALHRRLHHPHILRCLDGGSDSAGPWLVLEYAERGTLERLVALRGPLPEPVALAVAGRVALALVEAHAQRLVHRELKPGNIFIDRFGLVKLGDFGRAKALDDAVAATATGSGSSPPEYLSPELIAGTSLPTPACDQYGLGCLLFFCLTGRPPFTGDAMSVLHQHRNAPPPDPAATGHPVSEATRAILERCLAKDPLARFDDANALAAALIVAQEDQGGSDPAEWIAGPAPTTGPGTSLAEPLLIREPEDLLIQLENTRTMLYAVAERGTDSIRKPITGISSPGKGGWLTLVDADGRSDQVIHLLPKTALVFGKQARAPVDVLALVLPAESNPDACRQISRSHCRITLAAEGLTVEDLGSVNGTDLDRVTLPQSGRRLLADPSLHLLGLGGVLDFRLMAVPSRPVQSGPPGLIQARWDGLVVTRPDNRPGLAHLAILRHLLLGGDGADLALAGARRLAEVALAGGAWTCRVAPDTSWRPLQPGTVLDLDGLRLKVVTGDYTLA